MKYFLWLLRIIVGVLFIFSGLIKANDPLGLSYKMNEFFEVWHMPGLMAWSLPLSILMIGFEIIAGVALLIGAAFRVFSFLLLLLTTFFTFLTAYVYLTDKIKECGCFGDCIKISNAETFWKDVILLVLVIILFAFRKHIKPVFKGYPTTAIVILTAFFAFGIQWWSLEHLPFYDCLPYKAGNNLWDKSQIPPGSVPDSFSSVMIYKNTKTNQTQDIPSDSLMSYQHIWEDTVNWVFVDRTDKLVRKGNAEPPIKDFKLTDFEGNDHTEEILKTPGNVYLFFVRPQKLRSDNMERLVKLARQAQQAGIPFYVLYSGTQDEANAFSQKWNMTGLDFLRIDGIASKTGMRSNPGLMLIKDGTVQHKWSFRDYPAAVPANPQQPH